MTMTKTTDNDTERDGVSKNYKTTTGWNIGIVSSQDIRNKHDNEMVQDME